MDHNILWKILKEMGIPDHLTCLLRNLYTSQETKTVRNGVEQQISLTLGKEYVKVVDCNPVYLTYIYIIYHATSGLSEAVCV